MLSAKIINAGLPTEEIVIEGTLESYEKIPGYCCPGFDWEVRLIFPDPIPAYTSYWGCCYNPDCPVDAEDDQYRGVQTASGETIADWLLDQCEHKSSAVVSSTTAQCTWDGRET